MLHLSGLLKTFSPPLSVDHFVYKAITRSLSDHFQLSNPDQVSFLLPSVFAEPSSFFGWCYGFFEFTDSLYLIPWIIFVLGSNLSLTFLASIFLCNFGCLYRWSLFQRCTHIVTYNKQILTNNTNIFTSWLCMYFFVLRNVISITLLTQGGIIQMCHGRRDESLHSLKISFT